MRNRTPLRALFATAAAAAALAAAGSASALTMTVYNTDGPLPAGQTMIEDFDSAHVDGVNFTFTGDANTMERNGADGLWSGMSAPPPGDTTDYYTVLTNGKATLTSTQGLTSFSFYLGSPDNFNFVTFTNAAGSSFTLQGSQIWGASSGDNGDQSWGRRVNYDFDGDIIKKIEFTSTGNSFEFDSLAGATAAVPEPAAWALMIMGFGSAGAMLRRRRTASTFA